MAPLVGRSRAAQREGVGAAANCAALGLAIAHNLTRVNGGDLILAGNQPDRVCFPLQLPAAQVSAATKKGKDGPDPDSGGRTRDAAEPGLESAPRPA